ncbi:MAG: hypothetical protein EOP84_22155 [Verrucomicrobiaceae bacterium]|nr:MAG: hypothetical protein EOP84_22155 [Verrucomicrobiaceae bacterium]
METVTQPAGNSTEGTGRQPHDDQQETGRETLYISLGEAARTWGKHKGTVSKHIKDGKLQWHNQPNGTKKLFAPEVANLYGPIPGNVAETVQKPVEGTDKQPHATPHETGEIKGLEAALTAKEEVIALLRDQLADAKSQIERERQMADQWRMEYQAVKMLPAPQVEQKASKGIWPFRRKG